ncbi:MAG: DJ-1/PfpI family protein [Ignavibacteria bacterium]|nr:DJ-1/PfpI family protein [Ignavibacteria bacterium]
MKTKFLFLLLPQIHIMDFAGPYQALHAAVEYGAEFEIEYCSIEKKITSSAGLPIGDIKHYSKTNISKGDFLIIPGSNTSYLTSNEFKENKDLFKWMTIKYQNGVNLCSICVGAFALAECGLLDNIPCTTHFKKTKQLQSQFPKAKVIENILFTEFNGIYTSAGIASGIDLTLHIIEKIKGSYFAHMVARELVVYNRRNGNMSQESEFMKFRNHIHAGVHKAQDWIVENIDLKMYLTQLAEIAGMSERNFTRIFIKETGVTVSKFITLIRKEKINELLKNPDLSRIKIAKKVGLQSERQLSRIIKNQK